MPDGYTIDLVKKKSVTPVARGSYVHWYEPRPLPKGKPSDPDKLAWGMQCLFPKEDPAVAAWVKALNPLYGKVLIDKFGEEKAKEMAKIISTLRNFPVRDGDKEEDTIKISDPEPLEGCYFMNVNNLFKQPFLIGAMGKPVDPAIVGPDEIYSGAWYRVMLEFWYYDKAGNKGISASLAAIMKVKDDINLVSGTSPTEASDAFGDFKDEAASVFSEATTGSDESAGASKPTEPDPTDDFNFM